MSLLLVIILAGCTLPQTGESPVSPLAATADGVVLAVLDTGVNPYLDVFQANPSIGWAVDGATTAELSTVGDYAERERDDDEFWRSIEKGVLYRFTGSRLAAISFSNEPTILDDANHGAFTTFLAAREAPSINIVLVQVDAKVCTSGSCFISPEVADAMEWVAAQDWIDVVSVSIAIPANLPDRSELHPEMARYVAASRHAASQGKLVVNGAGNEVMPGLVDYFNGPPWIVAVGGVESETRGEGYDASRLVDVVSNYSEYVPAVESVGESELYEWHSGTSLATPIVAGTLAQAWHLAREGGAEPTPQQLRDAMNASAVYFNTTDWDPEPPERRGVVEDLLLYSSLPIVAQAQMGWGYVNGSLAPEIARRVLAEDFSIPEEKDQAMLVQPAWQRAREEFWARWG